MASGAPGPGQDDLRGDGRGHLRPLPFDAVRLDAGFLGGWQALNRDRVIPHLWDQLEESGVLDNFRAAADGVGGEHRGFNFADSDLYKTLEAVAWEAARVPAAQPWEQAATAAVALLRAAQRDDGYLYTHVQLANPGAAFAELRWSHELYVLGHLIQAAVARARATGRTDLLDVARGFAACADERLAALAAAGRPAHDGHPEVETALADLHRLTGERRWLDLARRQVAARGHGTLGTGPFESAYFQDHVPVRDAQEVAGHAVRQVYLAAGVADIVLELEKDGADDTAAAEAAALRAALLRLWDSAEDSRTYVTGGIGSRHKDEAFGDAYELPPDRAYAETCAAIGVVHWAWRMLLLTGEARFADAIERALYNAVPAGLGADGRSFFYSNPLQVRTGHDGSSEYSPGVRLPWFACACCPPNLARLAAGLHTYVATASEAGVQLHLYAAGEVTLAVASGEVRLRVETDYPWSGRVVVTAEGSPLTVPLAMRVPGWADGASVTVDGVPLTPQVRDGYALIPAAPDHPVREVALDLPMPAEVLTAHPRVDAVRGCVAVRRGPVVYCLEQADLPPETVLEDVALRAGTPLTVDAAEPALAAVGAPVVVRAQGVHLPSDGAPAWCTSTTVPTGRALSGASVDLTFVPYHAWAERDPGAMRVWVPVAEGTR